MAAGEQGASCSCITLLTKFWYIPLVPAALHHVTGSNSEASFVKKVSRKGLLLVWKENNVEINSGFFFNNHLYAIQILSEILDYS